tara:strand:+ start:734 stop:949 length:216 start_codon:yes stop_codon:yes gene_type:complete
MKKTKKTIIAQNECANWDCGNCIGCTLEIDKKYLKRNSWAPVFQTIISKKVNKPCTVEKGCNYFENLITER